MATIYVCLDDRNGMRFNGRRQSMDSAVMEDIRGELSGVLTVDPFSEGMMQRYGMPYRLSEEEMAADAHFLAENREAAELIPLADRIVVYRWNRHYPADTWWDMELMTQEFSLKETSEFPGSSHPCLTKEVYER